MNEIIHLILLAALSSVLATFGGILFIYNKRLGALLEKNSIPFAAGVLITVALIGLLPEAWHLIGDSTAWIALAAFFSAYLFEQFSFEIHHHTEELYPHKHTHAHPNDSLKRPALLVILGDTIHNFIDGIAIGAAFMINPGLALITAISTFLHEVPQEIGDFGIMLKAGWEKRKILIVNLLSASTTIIGALVLYFFLSGTAWVGALLAVAAGFFLYLGTIDFLPHAADGFDKKIKFLTPLALGVLAMAITFNIIPHAHESSENEGYYMEHHEEYCSHMNGEECKYESHHKVLDRK